MQGGAPKIVKSWSVLDWCIRIARGDAVWGMEVNQVATSLPVSRGYPPAGATSGVLYVGVSTPNTFFVTTVGTLADGPKSQISSCLLLPPDTVLIVVDTFQMVRGNANEPSYVGDSQDVQKLKRIVDRYNITVLSVTPSAKAGRP